jgi:hypothetical protein
MITKNTNYDNDDGIEEVRQFRWRPEQDGMGYGACSPSMGGCFGRESKQPLLCDKCSKEVAHVHQDGKHTYIEGNFLPQVGVPTANRRVYSEKCLDEALGEYQRKIANQNAYGHLGHTGNGQTNPHTVSHLVTNITKLRNGNYYGRARLLDTPSSHIMKSILSAGGKIGMSSSAMGSVKKGRDGLVKVQSPMHLTHVDAVLDPASANTSIKAIHECLIVSVLEESAALDYVRSYSGDNRGTTPTIGSVAKSLLMSLGRQDLLIDVDKTVAKYIINPEREGGEITYLQHLESDRRKLIAALLRLQKDIEIQHMDIQAHKYGSYGDAYKDDSKAIERTPYHRGADLRDPFKATKAQRAIKEQLLTTRLLEASYNLISRMEGSSTRLRSDSKSGTGTMIESIRRRSGTRTSELDTNAQQPMEEQQHPQRMQEPKTSDYAPYDAFTQAFENGRKAYRGGAAVSSRNPFRQGSEAHRAFTAGAEYESRLQLYNLSQFKGKRGR